MKEWYLRSNTMCVTYILLMLIIIFDFNNAISKSTLDFKNTFLENAKSKLVQNAANICLCDSMHYD